MSNSTTSWQEAVRLRIYQKYMAENPNSFDIPTQEEITRSDQKISFKFIDQDDRSTDRTFKAKEAHSKAFNPQVRSHLKPTNINTSTQKTPLFDHTLSKDPDGLNDKIRGKYAEVLKQDDSMLLARSWGVHPADLTKAFNRMGVDWVRKEIGFVAENKKVGKKGAYLAKILARNPY